MKGLQNRISLFRLMHTIYVPLLRIHGGWCGMDMFSSGGQCPHFQHDDILQFGNMLCYFDRHGMKNRMWRSMHMGPIQIEHRWLSYCVCLGVWWCQRAVWLVMFVFTSQQELLKFEIFFIPFNGMRAFYNIVHVSWHWILLPSGKLT